MGGQKAKTTEKSSGTQTVQLPQWMSDAGQRTYQQAEATAAANPITAYGGPMRAGMADNQAAAAGQAAGTANLGAVDMNAARALTGGAVRGASPTMNAGTFGADQAAQYMSPYTANVQGRTLMEMARQNAISRAGMGDEAAAAKAYGGTRHAVLEGEAAKGQNANMMDYLARSNADAYSNAQGQFNIDRNARLGAETQNGNWSQADRDRMLQAGGQAAQIGQTASGVNAQSIMNMLNTGGMEQGINDNQMQAAYQEFLRMQDAPMERSRDLMAMLAGTPRNMTTNTTGSMSGTSKSSPGLANMLMAGGQMAASIYSDRRLKRDIERVGELDDGLGLYRYRYAWDDEGTARMGVMADEVARLVPEALGPVVAGFATVDYSKVGRAL